MAEQLLHSIKILKARLRAVNKNEETAERALKQKELPGSKKAKITKYQTGGFGYGKNMPLQVSSLDAYLDHPIIERVTYTNYGKDDPGQLHIYPKNPFLDKQDRPRVFRHYDNLPKKEKEQSYAFVPDNLVELLAEQGYDVKEDMHLTGDVELQLSKGKEKHATIRLQIPPLATNRKIMTLLWIHNEKHAAALIQTLLGNNLPQPPQPKQLTKD